MKYDKKAEKFFKNRRQSSGHCFFSDGDYDGEVISQSMGIKSQTKTSASATSPCADLRIAYHNCFNRWYSEKFVKGEWSEEPCVSEWHKYRACLSEHLDDKKLKRFLEEETLVHSSMKGEMS